MVLRIAAAPLNPIPGAIAYNIDLVRQARKAAADSDLVVTTELVVSGYPPEDLVLRTDFLDAIETAVTAFAGECTNGPAVLLGAPLRVEGLTHNAVLLLEEGRIAAVVTKRHLPNYGVFDEKRVFAAGAPPQPIDFRGTRLGVMICEDMWFPDVSAALAGNGADVLIVPNGSPYETGKGRTRRQLAGLRVTETGLPLLYINQIGGQDEIVFDGDGFCISADGAVTDICLPFQPTLARLEWENGGLKAVSFIHHRDDLALDYEALATGLRDYVDKNGFPGIVLGLSGGIDSALAAAIAVDALGAGRVRAVMMPSPYTSRESLEDAALCASMLGIALDTIPIQAGMNALQDMVPELQGVAAENIQSRLRGMILMALSNQSGAMVLSTGNKSEMAVGYATLYGDMCGGFAVLKDVYKTRVFELAKWRNLQTAGPVMPQRVIIKPPSAELRPNQTDQDTLPPYEELDAALRDLIEGQGPSALHEGARIWRMLDRAEYKRRQSPPGVKITPRAFGRDRRFPITNHFSPPHDGK